MDNAFIEIACSFCGSAKHKVFDRLDGFTIVRCKKCNFHFTNPRPRPEDLPGYYDEAYFKDERHIDKFYDKGGKLKEYPPDIAGITMVENFVEKRGKILELGAAYGHFLKQLNDIGWDTEGIEISEDAVSIARKMYGLEMFCGELKDFHTSSRYDVIFMNQTLEHVPDPAYVLDRCRDLLQASGVLIISVPNIKSVDIKFNKERRRLSYDLPRHLNHFSQAFLNKELQKRNFSILETDLYYPAFILKWLERRKYTQAQTTKNNHNTRSTTAEINQKPLYKKSLSRKGKLLQMISQVFPGWKFTITARKDGE